MKNYRKSLICDNRAKKISSEPDAVIKRVTSGSRAIGSRPLLYHLDQSNRPCQQMTRTFPWSSSFVSYDFRSVMICRGSEYYQNNEEPFEQRDRRSMALPMT